MSQMLRAAMLRRRRDERDEDAARRREAGVLDLGRLAQAGQGPEEPVEVLSPGGEPVAAQPGGSTGGVRMPAGGGQAALRSLLLGAPGGGRGLGFSDLMTLGRSGGQAFVQLGNMAEALYAGDAVISGGQFIHAGSELALAGIEAPAVAGASGLASWAASNVFPILGAATAVGLGAWNLAEGNEEAGIGGLAGAGAGAAAGAAIGSVFPGVGTVIGALTGAGIGGAAGGGLGAMFAPGAPLAGYKNEGMGAGLGLLVPGVGPVVGGFLGHWLGGSGGKDDAGDPAVHAAREHKEVGRVRGYAGGLLGEIGGAASTGDLWQTLGKWQSGYVGGTSPQAIAVQLRTEGTGPEGFRQAVARGDIILPTGVGSADDYLQAHPGWGADSPVSLMIGQANGQYPVWSERGFFRVLQAHPEWLSVSAQAGVAPGMLGPVNEGIRQGILGQIQTLGGAGRAQLPLTPSMLEALRFPAAQAFLREHFPALGATG